MEADHVSAAMRGDDTCITCGRRPGARIPCCCSAPAKPVPAVYGSVVHKSTHSASGVRPGIPCAHTFQYLFTYPSLFLFLLYSSLLSPAMSAPTARRSQWKNPCSIDHSQPLDGGDVSMPVPSDAEILNRIIHLNNRVRPEVDRKMEAFVRSTYHVDEEEMLRDWSHQNMSWLSFVRDTIAQVEAKLEAQDDVDGRLTLGDALRIHFADLQRLAIGFEQMTVDAALYGDPNLDNFRRLQNGLMELLCELQISLLEKRLTADSSVTADIMGQEVRDLDTSRGRNLRNWVIIREYKVYLAHLHKVFGALKERLAQE